jgi:hypothetical protein
VDGLIGRLRTPYWSVEALAEAVDFAGRLVNAVLARQAHDYPPEPLRGRHARVAAMHLAFASDQVGSPREPYVPRDRLAETLLVDAIRLVNAAGEAIRPGDRRAVTAAVSVTRFRARIHLRAAAQALARELATHSPAGEVAPHSPARDVAGRSPARSPSPADHPASTLLPVPRSASPLPA